MVDLMQMANDFGTAAAPVATVVGGQALQTGTAASVTKIVTDIFKGAWGGNVDRHPPEAAVLGFAAVAGIIVVALIAIVRGIDLTAPQHIADTILGGIRDGAGGAVALTATHNAVRPSPPATPVNFQVHTPATCPSCGAALTPVAPATTQAPPLTVTPPPATSTGIGGFPFGPKG